MSEVVDVQGHGGLIMWSRSELMARRVLHFRAFIFPVSHA